MTALDRTRIEVIDLDTPNEIQWSGSVDDFDITQLSDVELDRLMDQGYVTVGGGAAPLLCVRFALAHSCKITELDYTAEQGGLRGHRCTVCGAFRPFDKDVTVVMS